MRADISWLLSCAVASIAALAVDARAERRTTEEVVLRKKPGEREAAVGKLPANTVVVIIGEDGRWLKVRARGSTGWVTRTTVTDSEPAVATTPIGGTWSAARRSDANGGDAGEVTDLFVEAAAPSALLRAPAPAAPKVADVAKGARLAVVDAASMPGWIHARDDHGHDGWIARAAVDNGAANAAGAGARDAGGVVDAPRESERDYARPARGPLVVRVEAGIAYRSLAMDMTTNADGGLTNYVVDANAVAAALDVDVVRRLGARVFAGGDARGQLADASPGLAYDGPSAPSGKIPFKTSALDVGARAGVHLKDAFDVGLRAGFHYDAFLPDNVANAGMLPRESLVGATVGLRGDIAPPRSRIGATLRFDALVVGSRAQTPGLQDGTSSTARALYGGATVRYLLARHVALLVAYDIGRATTSWSGMSTRAPGVTSASRVDTSQLLQIGIGIER